MTKSLMAEILENPATMAAVVAAGVGMLQDSCARVAAIRLYREAAKQIKVETGSSDPSEDWLMWDDSILHVGNPNGECFTPYVREVEPHTIGGKLLREELLLEMYQQQCGVK